MCRDEAEFAKDVSCQHTASNSSRLVSVTLWACFNVLCEGFLQATCLGLLRSFADDDSGLMLRTQGRPAHMNTEGILRAQNGLLYIDEARDAHLSRVETETFFQLVGDFAFPASRRRRGARVGPIVHKQIPSRSTSTRELLEQTTKMRRKQRSSVRTPRSRCFVADPQVHRTLRRSPVGAFIFGSCDPESRCGRCSLGGSGARSVSVGGTLSAFATTNGRLLTLLPLQAPSTRGFGRNTWFPRTLEVLVSSCHVVGRQRNI